MKQPDLPPIPKAMASKTWKPVFVAGAFFAWGLLVYSLYFL